MGCNFFFPAPAFRKHQASGHSYAQHLVLNFVLKIDHGNVIKSKVKHLSICVSSQQSAVIRLGIDNPHGGSVRLSPFIKAVKFMANKKKVIKNCSEATKVTLTLGTFYCLIHD